MIVTYSTEREVNLLTSKETVKLIIDALEDKKAENIQIIDISEVSSVADYFIITNGTNKSQVQALADNVGENWTEKEFMQNRLKDILMLTGFCWIIQI